MTVEEICCDPRLKEYKFGKAHPETYDNFFEGIAPLHLPEAAYLQSRGFSFIYDLRSELVDAHLHQGLLSMNLPNSYWVDLGSESELAAEGQLVVVHGASRLAHMSRWHPSAKTTERLARQIELDVLDTGKDLRGSKGVIPILIRDNAWRETLMRLKETYLSTREYVIPRTAQII